MATAQFVVPYVCTRTSDHLYYSHSGDRGGRRVVSKQGRPRRLQFAWPSRISRQERCRFRAFARVRAPRLVLIGPLHGAPSWDACHECERTFATLLWRGGAVHTHLLFPVANCHVLRSWRSDWLTRGPSFYPLLRYTQRTRFLPHAVRQSS